MQPKAIAVARGSDSRGSPQKKKKKDCRDGAGEPKTARVSRQTDRQASKNENDSQGAAGQMSKPVVKVGVF